MSKDSRRVAPSDREDFGLATEIDPHTSRTVRRLHRLRSVLEHRQPDLTVVLENVHDPHNVSAVLRSCDAVGVGDIHLLYTQEEFPDIGHASSGGVRKWMEFHHYDSVEKCVSTLRDAGYSILATSLGEETDDLYEGDYTLPTAFVFGNEHRGVSPEMEKGADRLIQIPMVGFVESLNISVASAVTLYEAMRQRLHHGRYLQSALSESDVEERMRDWARR